MIPKEIIIHHTASTFLTTIDQINQWHKVRDFTLSSLNFYIGYHYVIEFSGSVIQTRRDNEIGCHTIPNDGRIGICLIGNFNIIEPSDAQINSLIALVDKLKKTYNITDVWGHRDCNKTECPGDNLYKYVVKLSTINRLQRWIQILLMPK